MSDPRLTQAVIRNAKLLAHKHQVPGVPGCEFEDIEAVALQTALEGRTMVHGVITWLQKHGPYRRRVEGKEIRLRPDRQQNRLEDILPSGQTRIETLALPQDEDADEEDRKVLTAVSENKRGVLYSFGSGSARTSIPYGSLRRALDLYLVSFVSVRQAADEARVPPAALNKFLLTLGVRRDQASAARVEWQHRKGEVPNPLPELHAEALHKAHYGSKKDAGRSLGRSTRLYWTARRVQARFSRSFIPVGDMSSLSSRDRAIVRSAASGLTGEETARRFRLSAGRISKIVSPFRPLT